MIFTKIDFEKFIRQRIAYSHSIRSDTLLQIAFIMFTSSNTLSKYSQTAKRIQQNTKDP